MFEGKLVGTPDAGAFKLMTVVDRLPKTRSGKILRATMVKIADNEPYKCPPPSTTPPSSTRSKPVSKP